MTNEALSQFIDHIAKSAPHVWHGMVAYHRAHALTALGVTLAAFVATALVFKLALPLIREGYKENQDGKIAFAFLLLAAACGSSLYQATTLPHRVAEVTWPERAAALDMIEQIKKVPR